MANNPVEVPFFKIPLDYRVDVAIARAFGELVIALSNKDNYLHQKVLMKSLKEYSCMLTSILLISKVSYELGYAIWNEEFISYFEARWGVIINDITWGVINLANWCKNFSEVFCNYSILIGLSLDFLVSFVQFCKSPAWKIGLQALIQFGLIAAMVGAILAIESLIVPALFFALPFLNFVREGCFDSCPRPKILCKFAAQVAVMSLLLFSGLALPALIGVIAAIGLILHLTFKYGLDEESIHVPAPAKSLFII